MKLDSFPKILYINLARSDRRRHYMENLLKSSQLDYTRIDAIDGNDLEKLNKVCIPNPKLSNLNNACTCSHLTAIKYFYEKMTDETVIIFEDDVSFEFLQYIPFNWSDLQKNLPKDFDVVQLAITTDKGKVNRYLVRNSEETRYFCSAAYLISRKGAENILKIYTNGDKFDLSNTENSTADSMIIKNGITYSIPIFSYQVSESFIHPSHLALHSKSKKQQLEMWKNVGYFDLSSYFQSWPN